MNRPFRMLLVDDDVDMTLSLKNILEGEGYDVAVAHDGVNAQNLCETRFFDLCMIDPGPSDGLGANIVDELSRRRPGMEYFLMSGHGSLDGGIEAAIGTNRIIAREQKPLDINHLLHLFRQVAMRKQAQEALKKGERQFHQLLDHVGDAGFLLDPDGRIVHVNKQACESLGYSRDELLTLGAWNVEAGGEDPADWKERWRRRRASPPGTRESAHRRKDGSTFPVEVRMGPVRWESRDLTLILARDVTDRARPKNGLPDEKTLAEEYINSLPGLFYVFDERRFVRWNTKWNEITGYSDGELADKYGTDFFEGEDEIHIREKMEQVFREDASDAEAMLVTKHGEKIPYFFTGLRKKLNGKDHLIGLGIDITDRKKAETEKLELERRLQRAERDKSLARMAGAVAHHLNNMLQGTIGNLEMVREDAPPGYGLSGNIEGAMNTAWRAAKMGGNLLTVLGQSPGKPEPLDLSELCEGQIPELHDSLPRAAALETDLPRPGPVVLADLDQIRWVLTTLVANAGEALNGEAGKVGVSVGAVEVSDIPGKRRFPAEWKPSAEIRACLSVTDTGRGMDEKTIDLVFDPFYTDKATGHGLGLAMALGIIKAHNGGVTVDSKPGRGSAFRIFLPLSAESVSRPAHVALEKGRVAGETLLLVEDERLVRKVAREMLERMRFQVITAGDGARAVEIFRENKEDILLVLCDLSMPRKNGWETMKELRRIRPDIPVILISGYDEARVMANNRSQQPDAFLHKPYRMKALEKTIARVLAERGARRSESK